MGKERKSNKRLWMVLVIIICMGIILVGGIRYVYTLRENLTNQAIQNVLTVTQQQQQAFDNFISEDQGRLHSYADFFVQTNWDDIEENQRQMSVFGEVDAFFVLVNLDSGVFMVNKSDELFRIEGEVLESYRALEGRGTRDPFTSLHAGDMLFGYYERFTFADGTPGLLQKGYDRRKVSNAFSLSFYNDHGFAYVVNRKGEILLRSNGMLGDHLYDNIFEALGDTYDGRGIESFMEALEDDQTGSQVFEGDNGTYVYSYVPVENVEGWFLVSIVPLDAITEEADEILLDSKQALLILAVVLVICAVVISLIRRTHKDIQAKDQEIQYQEQLFNIFGTYLSNNTDDVYMMFDQGKEQPEYVSPNIERVFGLAADQITFDWKLLNECGHASGDTVDIEMLRKMKPGDSMEAMQTEWVNPQTGEHKTFRVNVYCILVQEMGKIVLYVSDRTQEQKTQNTLTEALEMAQVANNAKSAFLSSVSHDIRTPMNAITGLVTLLREDADKPEVVKEYAQRIDSASQHLLGLINDVLDMNKIESGNATLNIAELSMADIMDEINSIIRPQTKAKGQIFDLFASHLNYEHLQGDKLRINQILINLLSNAVKYTPEGGRIEMRVEELPQVVDKYSRIRFTISDNGMGMGEEYQKVIFDPFTREDSVSVGQIQGTGLGMAITKRLVDLMGGTIRVESEPGKGSVFTVELELYIQEQEVDPQFWKSHKVSRMIVADDDMDICRSIVKSMEGTGVTVHYSIDGETAIQIMRAAREAGHPYDLILLDWKMPDLNGMETARLIRKYYSDNIPILLFTAYDWGDIEQEAKEIGVDHFVPKPFFMSTFKEAIRRIMGSRQAEKSMEDNVVEGKHILVVDDIEINSMILTKILQNFGAACEVAKNGQEAVEIFEASSPGEYDLILMDIQMPIMDGYEATRTIRASSHPSASQIPIIAMTANAFVDDVRDAIDSGMDAHIAKPIQVEKLKETIRQVFDPRAGESHQPGKV